MTGAYVSPDACVGLAGEATGVAAAVHPAVIKNSIPIKKETSLKRFIFDISLINEIDR